LPRKWLLQRRDENGRSLVEGALSGPYKVFAMPSLMKLLTVIGVIVALGYGALVALTLVEPRTREMVVTVPPDRFVKPQPQH
jgi:hypothetical protein